MLAQKEEKYTAEFAKEHIVMKFVNSCSDQGITAKKSFSLLEELLTMVEKNQFDYEKWQGLVDKTIAEANNKEGVML